ARVARRRRRTAGRSAPRRRIDHRAGRAGGAGRAGSTWGPPSGGRPHGCFQSTRSTTSRLGEPAMSASTSEEEIVVGQLSYSFNQKRIRTNGTSGSPNRG